jgi:hypothetical protein
MKRGWALPGPHANPAEMKLCNEAGSIERAYVEKNSKCPVTIPREKGVGDLSPSFIDRILSMVDN